jgi:MerR family mercuric resistance operon transcriptional regulator
VFSAETVERVHFIKQAQDLGFSLDEIGTLFLGNGANHCLKVHDLIDTKVKELDERMRSMQNFREKLSHYFKECKEELKKHPNSPCCPVVAEVTHTGRR